MAVKIYFKAVSVLYKAEDALSRSIGIGMTYGVRFGALYASEKKGRRSL